MLKYIVFRVKKYSETFFAKAGILEEQKPKHSQPDPQLKN